MNLELTPAESAVASASEGVIRAMFGDSPADYAKFKFDCAVRKADMRSFKIRLLMIKARDSLTGDIHEEFHKWAPVYIEEAERVAGCIPCPGPRRLSKAEQERKRRREEAKNAYCELPFEEGVTIGECNSDNNEESVKKERPGRTSRSVKEALLEPISDGYPCVSKIISSMSKVLGENTIENLANQIKVEDIQHDFSDSSPADSVTVTPDQHDSESDVTLETCVTVTHHSDESVDAGHSKSTHKAREYSSASEILEDIKSGTIAPYKSATDIVDDMKRGVLSPPEA
ncbi:MAG: hypothetical protein II062_01125, partial [Oscillospiraceae bacterium]|nr:hypothetical protein [Oscillospiraceae bacterium]